MEVKNMSEMIGIAEIAKRLNVEGNTIRRLIARKGCKLVLNEVYEGNINGFLEFIDIFSNSLTWN
jgi:IS30 family transposase